MNSNQEIYKVERMRRTEYFLLFFGRIFGEFFQYISEESVLINFSDWNLWRILVEMENILIFKNE
jgi:hypothetical protein